MFPEDGRKLGVRHERSQPYLAREEARLATTQADDYEQMWWDFYHKIRSGESKEEYSCVEGERWCVILATGA